MTLQAVERAQARFDEGQAFVEQKKWDEALAAYRAAVEEDPEMSEAWYEIGMAETNKHGGKPCESAYGPFKRSVELDPDNAHFHCCLGYVVKDVRKDHRRAEEHFRAAIRLDPKYASAHSGLAHIHKMRGDYDGAIREMLAFTRLSEDEPDNDDGEANPAELRAAKERAAAELALASERAEQAAASLLAEAEQPPSKPSKSSRKKAALLEKKKKSGGRAAKPDAEAQARFPPSPRLVAPAPRLRATSCG